MMFKRQTSGSVVCASCGYLVGVNDDRCYHCGRRHPGLWGFAGAVRNLGHDMGFVPFVMGSCILLYILTLIASRGEITGGGMFSFLGPSTEALNWFGASGVFPVFVEGRWWTVLSAAWLHAGLLHIFFNLWALRQVGPPVAEFYGPGRMVIIYTVGAIVGFTATSLAGAYLPAYLPRVLQGAPFTIGASAPIMGLVGSLVYYGRRGGSSLVRSVALQWAIYTAVFGLIMPGVDNYAHAGGFLGGYLAARVLDPLKPERVNHIVIAIGCLVLSLLSIIASLVTGLPAR